MTYPALPDPSEVENCDMPWSERIPQAMGLFALSIGVVLLLQRHQFTAPGRALPVVLLVIAPWVIDMLPQPRSWVIQRRMELPINVAWAAVVLGGVALLVDWYRGPNDFAPFIVTILVGEMTSTIGPRFGAVVWAASVGLLFAFIDVAHFDGMWIWAFAFTIGWMGGAAFRRQVQITYVLAEAQSQLAQRAAEEERHRLARDVHDLVAHSLAVTMLQLSGARLALRAGDTDDALEALQEAESAGRQAMAEIHRTVGLLGAGSAAVEQPTPSASDLPTLVTDFRRAGLAVDFDLDGDLQTVPLAIGLASYRMVQESLSNAVKHAPGAPVRLAVRVSAREIEILATNPVLAEMPKGPGGGHGVRGLTERAELLGGAASAGNGDGTWKVRATIPWQDVVA